VRHFWRVKVNSDEQWTLNIEQWESRIREGKGSEVQSELTKLTYSKIPRTFAAKISNFLYRLNSPNEALKILNPIIRPKNSFDEKATEHEIAEYSVTLLRIGAAKEATKLLAQKKMEVLVETFLYRAFADMSTWSYKKAVKNLKKYIKLNEDDYMNLIAKVNMSACLINMKNYDEAHDLLDEIIHKLEEDKNYLLLGNVHELMAQSYYFLDQSADALIHLEKAEKYLKESNTIGKFFVKKWKTFLKIKSSDNVFDKKRLIEEIRIEAHQIGHYESVRNCDFLEAKEIGTKSTYLHLLFGTPFKELHQDIVKILPEGLKKPKEYLLGMEECENLDQIFSLKCGELLNGKVQLKPTQVNHRLLMILSEDFYRPKPSGQLFGELFPDEFFNPNTSPDRVHKAIGRFRKWTKEERIPFSIEEEDGQYLLKVGEGFALKVELKSRHYSLDEVMENRLRRRWPKEYFSRAEGAKTLGLKPETFQHVIKEMLLRGIITSNGKGSKQKIIFKNMKIKKLSA
jgi:tetratricopeptide (TPR) repeat protein